MSRTTQTRGLLINGEQTPAATGRTTTDTNPFTGTVMATVAAAGPEDVTRAVDAASAAATGWAETGPTRRRRLLWRAADLLEARGEQAAALMASETGATFGWSMFNVGLAANTLREAGAMVTAPLGDVLATDNPHALGLAVRQPVGVVAAFTHWTAPIAVAARAVATPLAVGDTAVLKASEDAPLAGAHLLADVLNEAGLPPGVLNVITNDRADAAEVARSLVADARVRRVSFTGSTAAGREVGVLAARHLTPAVLALGGKNSLIVLPDADLAYAVEAVAFGAYLNSGQICTSADRVLVHRAVAEEFGQRLAAKAASLHAGDPTSPANALGPLIDAESARRVAGLVAEAAEAGARVLAGGGDPDGAVYPATVLAGVVPQMRVYQEEIFGPVCTVLTVDGVDEAVRVANDSPYGLTAGVLTEDLNLGWTVACRLRSGVVHVNDQCVDEEPQAPFGGVKDSGYGRFGGRAGIEAFTDLRWISLQQRHRHFPL